MEVIKRYKRVIAVVGIIMILVIIRSLDNNHFQTDTRKWAKPSVSLSNIITPGKAGSLKGEILLICLNGAENTVPVINGRILHIAPDSILSRKNLKTIKKHSGPILLYSTDDAMEARIWMILSQLGLKNVLIMSDNVDDEVFKSKFRPDSLVRPEI